VFSDGRIERIKKLLDDLQSRLDPTAVAVVREQLDLWRDEVPKRLKAKDLPALKHVREGLRRQTVIWRQLIAGDKRPEAYLGAEERAQVRDTLRDLALKRYRLWVLVVAIILAALVLVLPRAAAWYRDSVVPSGLASVGVAVIGALGITRASLVMTARGRLHDWADLLWQRAVITEVAQATLTVDQVFCGPREREHSRIVAATARTAARLRVPAQPAHEGEAR
jgi:hypothetical protein